MKDLTIFAIGLVIGSLLTKKALDNQALEDELRIERARKRIPES